MGKAFSENEKVIIREKLINGAMDCMIRYGIRKTTVDELVRIAGISKGAFYFFYDSKEMLMYDAIMSRHDMLQSSILYNFRQLKGRLTVESMTKVCFKIIKTNQEFWAALLSNGDVDYLLRKLPPETTAQHLLDDDDFARKIMESLPVRKDINVPVVMAAFRAIFMSTVNTKVIGDEQFDEAIKLLLRGLISQILE